MTTHREVEHSGGRALYIYLTPVGSGCSFLGGCFVSHVFLGKVGLYLIMCHFFVNSNKM